MRPDPASSFSAPVAVATPNSGAARPHLPRRVDALINILEEHDSIAVQSLIWLRPDGTYVVLCGREVFSMLPYGYCAGKIGSYTLSGSYKGPTWQELVFDGTELQPLEFTTHTAYPGRRFHWAERAAPNSMANTSGRAYVTAEHPAMTGFHLPGTKSRWVLIRGIGPGLAKFGVRDALPAPRLAVYRGASEVEGDPDHTPHWGCGWEAGLEAAFALTGAFPLERGSADNATLLYLAPGCYSVEISSATGEAGSALTEVYLLPYAGE